MSRWISLASVPLLVVMGCGSSASRTNAELTGYLATSPCAAHSDSTSCTGDTAARCAWQDLGVTCPAGTICPEGVCIPIDRCTAITGSAACIADDACAWSEADRLCPAGANCASGGYCHARTSDGSACACVSPAYCPAGTTCPPMECDCAGGGSGGGTCSCACASCLPGSTCPPCDCTCGEPTDGSCIDDGTCACACPACAPGESCPPCSCDCVVSGMVSSGGSSGDDSTGTSVCTCPSCAPGEACSPCSCIGGTGADGGTPDAGMSMDPCADHTDETTCRADTGNDCAWFAMGMPCRVGEPCRSGVCQQQVTSDGGSSGSGAGCVCACPACSSGEDCSPCSCTCGDMSDGSSCTPPPAPPGGPICPALGCYPQCPNGVLKDENGCDTCTCR